MHPLTCHDQCGIGEMCNRIYHCLGLPLLRNSHVRKAQEAINICHMKKKTPTHHHQPPVIFFSATEDVEVGRSFLPAR